MITQNKHKLIIPLYKKDILGNTDYINVVWVNQMYTWGHTTWRKWKRITPEAVKYKNYLKSFVDDFRMKNGWVKDDDLKEPIFYTVVFHLQIPENKEWKLDERYVRDVDNLLKPLQDSFESDTEHKRIWKNDKLIRCVLASIEYNSPEPQIEINLYKYDKTKVKQLYQFIDQNF